MRKEGPRRLTREQFIRSLAGLAIGLFLAYLIYGNLIRVLSLGIVGIITLLMLYYRWPIDLWSVNRQRAIFASGIGFLGVVIGTVSFLWLFLQLSTAPRPPRLLFLSVLFASYSIGALVGYLLTKTERFKYRFAIYLTI